jgi:hypothetical protein
LPKLKDKLERGEKINIDDIDLNQDEYQILANYQNMHNFERTMSS